MVERYFVEVMDIPQLQDRVECFLFTRQFASNAQRVCEILLKGACHGAFLQRQRIIVSANICKWHLCLCSQYRLP